MATDNDMTKSIQVSIFARWLAAIENCDRTVTFDAPPEWVVVNDVNITEMFLTLDLQDRLVVLPLPSVFEGVRNPDAVETLARGFYPEKFTPRAQR